MAVESGLRGLETRFNAFRWENEEKQVYSYKRDQNDLLRTWDSVALHGVAFLCLLRATSLLAIVQADSLGCNDERIRGLFVRVLLVTMLFVAPVHSISIHALAHLVRHLIHVDLSPSGQPAHPFTSLFKSSAATSMFA